MALATRCPQCGTAFRLVADQLRLHDGLVRCGACSAIFDGRQNQFEVGPAGLPGASDAALSPPAPPVPAAPPVVPPVVSPAVPSMTPTLVDAPPPTPVSPPIPEPLPELPELPPAVAAVPARPAVVPAPPVTSSAPPAPHAFDTAPPAPRVINSPPPAPAPANTVSPVPPAAATPRAADDAAVRPTPAAPTSPAARPALPGEMGGVRELGAGAVGIRELAPRGSSSRDAAFRNAAARTSALRPREPAPPADFGGEPSLPAADFPDIGPDDASAHGPGAREPSLHEPLPLAPSGDASLLHAPQSFAARDASDAAAENRREPRLMDPVIAVPAAAAGPREPVVSKVRASVIDDGLPTPRLRTRADGSIPDLHARLRADADAEAASVVPELRRESADPTAPIPDMPRDAPAEPIYAWDPATEDTETPEPVAADAPGAGILDEPDEPPVRRPVWPWVLGTLAAALVLGAQALWVWRDDIATNFPVTRPLLTSMCAPFGCTVGYPRHPELLSIESSALEPWQNEANAADPGSAPNRLALRVVLRNRHTLPQPWPSIELTLTDLSDTAVVRRVLSPSDYLPADTVAKPMPPRSERSLRVPVDPPAESVSGYRLSVFFP